MYLPLTFSWVVDESSLPPRIKSNSSHNVTKKNFYWVVLAVLYCCLTRFTTTCFFSLLVLINLYLQNKKKKKKKRWSFFFSLFGFYNVVLACKLHPCYLPFFAIFTVILSEYSQISLIWLCFFFSKKVHDLSLVWHMGQYYCFSD